MRKITGRICKVAAVLGAVSFMLGVVVSVAEKITGKQGVNTHIPYGPYEKYVKRPLDFSMALLGMTFLWPVLAVTALLVRHDLGSPVIFRQARPGRNEEIFWLHKFRSMTDKTDESGRLLSDSERLTAFGGKLRSSSMDELPELVDILQGNLSIVGPRPQLVRDMVFMKEEHRKRHEVMPGLTGLAQINGRNDIDWERKLDYDVEYARKISFLGDIKIILLTVGRVLCRDGIQEEGQVTAVDYGDYLLTHGRISLAEYERGQVEARSILENFRK